MIQATKNGVFASLALFEIVGLFSLFIYGTKMNDTILSELDKDMKVHSDRGFLQFLIIVICISFVVSCLSSFPVLFFSLKENFIKILLVCKKALPENSQRSGQENDHGNAKDKSQEENKEKKVEIKDGKNCSEVDVKVDDILKKDEEGEVKFSRFETKIIVTCLYLFIFTKEINNFF